MKSTENLKNKNNICSKGHFKYNLVKVQVFVLLVELITVGGVGIQKQTYFLFIRAKREQCGEGMGDEHRWLLERAKHWLS